MNIERNYGWRMRFLRSRFVALLARMGSWFVSKGHSLGRFADDDDDAR